MNSISETGREQTPPDRSLSILPHTPPGQQTSVSDTATMDKRPASEPERPLSHHSQAAHPQPLRRVDSDETQRPLSAQQPRHDNTDDQSSTESEEEQEESQEDDSDPAHQIDDFDWDDLHRRYHEAMSACHGEETALMEEWENLMTYFRLWAQSGHEHETGRTYARLCTRTTYVKHSEDTLEQKRNHYISVVKAFESALNLLKANGMGR